MMNKTNFPDASIIRSISASVASRRYAKWPLVAVVILLAAAMLAGCSDPADSAGEASRAGSTEPRIVATRWYSDAQVRAGSQIFQNNCAVCHGVQAQGAINWQYRGPDGKFPPPPLNGTAHAWHHPLAQLFQMVKEGTQPAGNMPAWGGTLTDEEILATIAWFQSQWPDEVYQAWFEMEMRARASRQ